MRPASIAPALTSALAPALASALALAIALAPAVAQALSCLAPNPARQLDALYDQGANPQIAIGTLSTPFDNDNGRYRFDGRMFGAGITIDRLSSGIEVRATCAAEWCGTLPREPVQGLFVIDGTAQGLLLTLDPCGGGAYAEPDEAGLRALQRCIAARGCSDAEIGAFDG